MRTLHRYQIDGITLLAYDETGSCSADWIGWELEANDYRLRTMLFEKGDVVIDIGAHVGLVSMYLAKRWPDITVYAFEPCPANFANCVDNLVLNGVTNVLLSAKAIANDHRLLNMTTDPQNSGGASALVKTFDCSDTASDIASITLEEVFSMHKIGRCKLLKIDCEGMEYEILFSARVLDKVEFLAGEFHANTYLQNRGWCPERLYRYCSSILASEKMAITFNTIAE